MSGFAFNGWTFPINPPNGFGDGTGWSVLAGRLIDPQGQVVATAEIVQATADLGGVHRFKSDDPNRLTAVFQAPADQVAPVALFLVGDVAVATIEATGDLRISGKLVDPDGLTYRGAP
jgi:hypothetical protein